jgi:translation elongation factor EF-4
MAQVVTDFFDELKSRSKGYASMEYSITGYRKNDLVRLDIKINNEVRSAAATRACRVGDH